MPELSFRVGTCVAGSYDLERELGAGAMATVFLAHDRKHDRKVAVKVLRPEIALSIGSERFLQEIRFAAKLAHPHILPLFDSGQADGFLFYVMPNIEGKSLRDRLSRESTLSVEEAIRIGLQVAEALDYAHRHGVVHRDVKPENIMLHDGHALVGDFGIGKATSAVEGVLFTQSGVAVGTPAYMSPEQAAGDLVDGRSDIYSLGCVLYEMLIGEQPFTASTVQAVIAKRFVHNPADVATLRPGVPHTLGRTVSRALQRAPDDRFTTAADLARALQDSNSNRAWTRSDTLERSIAVLPFENMSSDLDNEFFADGITEDILNALSRIRDLRVAGRTSAFSFKNKKQDLRAIANQLQVSTVLDGSVRRSGNRVRITVQLLDVATGHQLWTERYDREIQDVFAVQDEIAAEIAARMKATIESTRAVASAGQPTDNMDAYDLYLRGRTLLYRRGVAVKQGMACMEHALALDPEYGLALAGLADAHTLRSIYGSVRPEDAADKARSLSKRAVAVAPHVAETNTAMAMVHLFFDWQFDAAERLFAQALKLNPGYGQAAVWYSLFYVGSICGRWPEAIEGIAQVQKLDRLSGYVAAILSVAHSIGGDLDEALRWSDKALELDPDAYLTQWTRQQALVRRKDWTRALEASETVLAAFGRPIISLGRYGVIFAQLGQLEEARSVYREIRERQLQSRARGGYIPPAGVALLASAIGETESALEAAREAFARRDPQLIYMARSWPEYEYLRPLPAFQELLRAMNLPQ